MTAPAHHIVNEQGELVACCQAWRAAGRMAFDTEFIRDDTFEPILCLIQVATPERVALVDPMGLDVTCFWDVVADPHVLKIVHAGKEDFDVALRTSGRLPRNVFDVQIAAGFVGYGYPLSLARLADQVLGVRVAKGHTLTDWSRRPLTPEQEHYAVEDVAYLHGIHTKLANRLKKRGREVWAREEFERFEQEEMYRIPAEERAARLKGSARLDGLGLLVLERLVEWREAWARRKNRPIRALIRDDILVEIARRRPTQARELEILRGFPQARNQAVIQEILDLIRDAAKTPVDEHPKPVERQDDGPMTKALLDLLSAVVQCICHESDLAWSLLGSAQRLREVLDFHAGRLEERPPLLRGWRGEFIGEHLIDLLQGRSSVHVAGTPDAIKVELTSPASGRLARPKSQS